MHELAQVSRGEHIRQRAKKGAEGRVSRDWLSELLATDLERQGREAAGARLRRIELSYRRIVCAEAGAVTGRPRSPVLPRHYGFPGLCSRLSSASLIFGC
jgi:hypothetical protein